MSLRLSEIPKKLHCGCGTGLYDGPKKRPPRKSDDPSNPTPTPRVTNTRPPIPTEQSCNSNCFPWPLPKTPAHYGMKLRQLEDCYECRVSKGCHNRKKMFYDRWQTYLDRLKRYPNYDYQVYCCDDYKDLGENSDFVKFTDYWPKRKAPREMAQRNYLFAVKCLPEVHGCLLSEFGVHSSCDCCVPKESYPCPWPDNKIFPNMATYLDAKVKLYLSDGEHSIWHEKLLRPERIGYVEGTTAMRSRIKPFRKDCAFSTPDDGPTNYATGNLSPYKEIRDLKMM